MFGGLISVVTFGAIAKTKGSKYSIKLCFLIAGFSIYFLSISPNYESALLFYFFSGFGMAYVAYSGVYL